MKTVHNFDADCQKAVDLAKSALADGVKMDARVLLAALYHATQLHELFPALADYLKPLEKRRAPPIVVPVHDTIEPLIRDIEHAGHTVTANEMFFRLLKDKEGRKALLELGADAAQIDAVILSLGKALHAAPAPPPAPPVQDDWRASAKRQEATKALSAFGRVLTEGDLPDRGILQRKHSVAALTRALARRKQRNALIIGLPGTGKTAIVYEFARRLAARDSTIPERLRDYDIFELSPAFLRAGTSMLGEYDKRVKALITILKRHPKIVLFVDEVHSLLQSGVHYRGPFTEANEAFKTELGHGTITCIGCTTTSEFRHFIAPDEALVRRFSVIEIPAPSPAETVDILECKRPRLQSFYGVSIPDAILKKAVDLTEAYVAKGNQPAKSIRLLDDACTDASMRQPPPNALDEQMLETALEHTLGRPITRANPITVAEVFDRLTAKLVGQDEVLLEIAEAFVAGVGDWRTETGPLGIFLFAGPTGVGKTETALELAEILGAGRRSLVRVDCNTLAGSALDGGPAINRLIGAPPAYVGYARGEGGLFSRVRDYPECVVLFDEFEKAPPHVGELLLQIMESGTTEDVDGNAIDFRRAFLIFTTNAGSHYEMRAPLGFGQPKNRPERTAPWADAASVQNAIRATGLGQEFLARIRDTFIFKSLDSDAIRQVLVRQLGALRAMAEPRGYALTWENALVPHLVEEWEPRLGVRHLVSILHGRVLEQISIADAQQEMTDIKAIHLEVIKQDERRALVPFAGAVARERRDDTLVVLVG